MCGSIVAVWSEEKCHKTTIFGLPGLSMENEGEFLPIEIALKPIQ